MKAPSKGRITNIQTNSPEKPVLVVNGERCETGIVQEGDQISVYVQEEGEEPEQFETPIGGEVTAEDLEAGPLYINRQRAKVGDRFSPGDLLSIGPPSGLDGKEFCHRCDKETDWVPLRRCSRRVRCSDCGMGYPCTHKCKHLDCALDRRQQRIK